MIAALESAQFKVEGTYGTDPGITGSTDFLLSESGLTLTHEKTVKEIRTNATFPDPTDQIPVGREISGSLNTLFLHAGTPTAQALVNMAYSRTAGVLDSYTFRYDNDLETRVFTGMKCSQLAISGGDGDEIRAAFDFTGQKEDTPTANAITLPSYSGVPYMFYATVLTINSVVLTDLESFTLTIANELQPGPKNSNLLISFLEDGYQVVTLEYTHRLSSVARNTLLRGNSNIEAILQIGDGTDTATFTLHECQVVTATEDAGSQGETVKQTVSLVSRYKPGTGFAEALDVAFS